MSPKACAASLTPAVDLSKGVIPCVTVYTRNGALQALSIAGNRAPHQQPAAPVKPERRKKLERSSELSRMDLTVTNTRQGQCEGQCD